MDPTSEPANFRRADELPLPGSIDSPPRVVYRAVVALGESLARAGLRTVMVTNAHGGPRHAAALEAASRRVSRRRGIAMFSRRCGRCIGSSPGRRWTRCRRGSGAS